MASVGGIGATVEGVRNIGPALISEFLAKIEYATGLGIGMSDLPYEAIEWVQAIQAAENIIVPALALTS